MRKDFGANSELGGCGRYEFSDDKSHKYWRVYPKDSREPYGDYVAEWGRIGSSGGQSQQIDRETAAKRIREKKAKGYVLVKEEFSGRVGHTVHTVEKIKENTNDDEADTSFSEELERIRRVL